jgi:N-acetylglucosamine kinase-like BadF-type ATPase
MTWVAGVDGGGTHTRAVIIDAGGRALGRAEAGSSLVRADRPAAAAAAVSEAVRGAAAQAGVSLPLGALWGGLAGAGSRESSNIVAAELKAAGLADLIVVGTDVDAAFHAAFGDGPGILLIAGTGSIARARGASGSLVRVGGWGDRIGDEGSGFAVGMAALRAIAQAHDGRGPATAIRGRVMEHLSLQAAGALIPWTAGATKADVAALVPLVAAAAAEGDPVAVGILDAALRDLCAHLRSVIERASPWDGTPELVLWGGLFRAGGPMRDAMATAAEEYPVRYASRAIDPAMGAAKLALATLSGPPPAP